MKNILTFLAGVLLVMQSGCATMCVRGPDRDIYPALYPAVRWDYDGVDMFTSEGSTQEAVFVILLFGICDGSVSIITDTICLPWDLIFWLSRKKVPSKKASDVDPHDHGGAAVPPNPGP